MSRYYGQMRCCECGRFISSPADSGTMYGGPEDSEPPEEDLYCKTCADKNLAEARAHPENVIIGCWWLKPHFAIVADMLLKTRAVRGNHGHN